MVADTAEKSRIQSGSPDHARSASDPETAHCEQPAKNGDHACSSAAGRPRWSENGDYARKTRADHAERTAHVDYASKARTAAARSAAHGNYAGTAKTARFAAPANDARRTGQALTMILVSHVNDFESFDTDECAGVEDKPFHVDRFGNQYYVIETQFIVVTTRSILVLSAGNQIH